MNTKYSNDMLSVILNRKSVRNFTGKAVNRKLLETLLKAAMAAPSAANKQPWSFIAITDSEIIKELADKLPNTPMLKTAGAAIAVCGIPEKSFPDLQDYWTLDCAAATQNILLAAEAIGLGAVWIAVHQRQERAVATRKILNIPENAVPFNIISIGHPIGGEKPTDKFTTDNVHWERW